jgi:hypothetical protein
MVRLEDEIVEGLCRDQLDRQQKLSSKVYKILPILLSLNAYEVLGTLVPTWIQGNQSYSQPGFPGKMHTVEAIAGVKRAKIRYTIGLRRTFIEGLRFQLQVLYSFLLITAPRTCCIFMTWRSGIDRIISACCSCIRLHRKRCHVLLRPDFVPHSDRAH